MVKKAEVDARRAYLATIARDVAARLPDTHVGSLFHGAFKRHDGNILKAIELILELTSPKWIPIAKAVEMGYAAAIGKLDDPLPPEVFILLPGKERRVTFGFLVIDSHSKVPYPIVANYRGGPKPRWFMPVPKWPSPPLNPKGL